MSRAARRTPALLSPQGGLSASLQRGRVLHRRAIVSARFGGDGGCLVRINSRSLVGQGDLQSEFTAIKKLVCYGNRRRLVF